MGLDGYKKVQDLSGGMYLVGEDQVQGSSQGFTTLSDGDCTIPQAMLKGFQQSIIIFFDQWLDSTKVSPGWIHIGPAKTEIDLCVVRFVVVVVVAG